MNHSFPSLCHRSVLLPGFLAIIMILLFLPQAGLAKIPEPDSIIYGLAGDTVDMVTLKIGGEVISSYTMAANTNPDAEGFYILRIHMDALLPADPGTARPGDEAEIFVNDEEPAVATVTIQEKGSIQVLHLGAQDSDEDGLPDEYEQRIVDTDPGDAITSIFDVLLDDDFDRDGESNWMEWVNGTDPVDATSTSIPANAYGNFHLAIFRAAWQPQPPAVDFIPDRWGARLICRPKEGETILSGLLTKPEASSGAGAVALEISEEGNQAEILVEHVSFEALATDYVAGEYGVDLVMDPDTGEDYHLRFKLIVTGYTEGDFPEYVMVEDPTAGATGVSVMPLLDFDTSDWNLVEIVDAAAWEQACLYLRWAEDPLDTYQVPEDDSLQSGREYVLKVAATDWLGTWMGSVTQVVFTTGAGICYGDIDFDRDVDGLDMGLFTEAYGSSIGSPAWNQDADFNESDTVDDEDLEVIGSELGRSDCP